MGWLLTVVVPCDNALTKNRLIGGVELYLKVDRLVNLW